MRTILLMICCFFYKIAHAQLHIEKNGLKGIANKSGKVLIIVKRNTSNSVIITYLNNKMGAYDQKWKLCFEPTFDKIGRGFWKGIGIAQENGKSFLIDLSGHVLKELDLDEISDAGFSNGLFKI